MLTPVVVLTTLARLIAFGTAGTRATTIAGWTPGLRALLAGHVLQCGCLAGIYQTCFGEVASIVDAAADGCRERHLSGQVLGRAPETGLHAVVIRSSAATP